MRFMNALADPCAKSFGQDQKQGEWKQVLGEIRRKSLVLRSFGTVIILFGVFLISFIWIGLYFKVQSERQLASHSAEQETANLARAFEEHTLRTITSTDQAVLFLKYQYQQEGRMINIPGYINEGRLIDQPFVQLSIVDESGDLVATSQVPFEPTSSKGQETFLHHQNVESNELYIGKPIGDPVTHKQYLPITRRINKPAGSFGGMVVAAVDPLYFGGFYRQMDLGKNSVILLIGSDGIVRSRQNDQNLDSGQDLSKSLLMEKLKTSNVGSYVIKSPIDGVTRLYSYRALLEYPLIVSVGVDIEEVLFAVNQRIRDYYLGAAGMTAAIIYCILLLLSINTKQKRGEEELKKSRDNLECQVTQRTQQLFTANSELHDVIQNLKEEIYERTLVEGVLRQKERDLQRSKDLICLAAGLAHVGPWVYHPETKCFEFGDEFYAILGTDVSREGQFMAHEMYVKEFVHTEDANLLETTVCMPLAQFKRSLPISMKHRLIRRDGEVRTVIAQINMTGDCNNHVQIFGAIQDITELVRAEESIQEKTAMVWQMAYFDSMTGLPNRAQLNKQLTEELKWACKENLSGVVLFIDLDDLKMVNDTYGHTYGDTIIIAAGNRIVSEVGKLATVAHIGGDEFIVTMPGDKTEQEIANIASKIIKSLAERYEIEGRNFHMTASLGIAIYPIDGNTVEEIIKNADNAMYAAKRNGKNNWRFYTTSMQVEAYQTMRLISSLRYALARGELSLYYQPQILTKGGKVGGFEALIRWNSSEYGAVSPGQFIPLAEQSGLIHSIGKWVLEESCQFARHLVELGWGNIPVSVNISSKQLTEDGFILMVRNAISGAGIQARQIKLEITESLLMTSLSEATTKLNELNAFGVGFSLDDFGTGYSSLTYLYNLPVETLKIDKSFVDLIATDDNVAKIIGSIISMAHIFDMTVIAEGVETTQQLAYLVDNGCDGIQGYLFSRPLPESEAIKFLQAQRF